MKQIMAILGLALILVQTIATRAENYFRPGTVWEIASWAYDGENDETIEHEYSIAVLDAIEFEGEEVLPFVINPRSSNEKLIYYLRTEGEKVFWRPTTPGRNEWYLLYDFGLQVGDEVVITSALDDDFSRLYSTTMRCIEREYTLSGSMGTWMKLCMPGEGKYGNYPADGEDGWITSGEWLIGIGWPYGIADPNHFGYVSDGGECIEKVTIADGIVIYDRNAYAGINCPADSGFSVNGPKDGLYDLKGMPIPQTSDIKDKRILIEVENGTVKKVIR